MTHNAQLLARLTRKQRDVLALVADNRTSKEIAGLLGISESAVNQRIEMVRARLGGLPRGELARIYRQEYGGEAPVSELESDTWQKIQLPELAQGAMARAAGGVSTPGSDGSHYDGSGRDGSQPSAVFIPTDENGLWRDHRATALVRFATIAAIIGAALAIAVTVTEMLTPLG